jgi:hypothetical protein
MVPAPELEPFGAAYQPLCTVDETVTVTAALAVFPPLVALMVAVPAAIPDTCPLLDTVATAALLVDHVTGEVITWPGCAKATA